MDSKEKNSMIILVYPETVSSKIQHPFRTKTLINVKQDTFLTGTNHLWKTHNSLYSVREEHSLPFQEGSKDSCLLPLYFNSALEVLANALKQENICTHIYTHTYTIHIYNTPYTYTHICQCTYTYTQIHTQIHPYTDTNTQTYTYTNTHKHTHTYTNKYTQTHT